MLSNETQTDQQNTIQSPDIEVNHPYCTEPIVPIGTLTLISLPDSSFQRNPALSHHFQELDPEVYQHGINEGIPVTSTSNYPRSLAPSSDLMYALDHGIIQPASMLPQAPPEKRVHCRSSTLASCKLQPPINILPNPEGLRQMELDRLCGQPCPKLPPRPRALWRGRRYPQAEIENAFVEELREQKISWKAVRETFQEHFNKDVSEARLQMRLLRHQREQLKRYGLSN